MANPSSFLLNWKHKRKGIVPVIPDRKQFQNNSNISDTIQSFMLS